MSREPDRRISTGAAGLDVLLRGGLPADAWGLRGMRGRLTAEMSVGQPASVPVIEEPASVTTP
jgi:hypothetical protein